jgi:hypothetical protein
MNFLQTIEQIKFSLLIPIVRFIVFITTSYTQSVRPPFFPQITLINMLAIKCSSVPVARLTVVFAGMELAIYPWAN